MEPAILALAGTDFDAALPKVTKIRKSYAKYVLAS